MIDYCAGCPRRLATLPGNSGAVGPWGELNAPFLVVGSAPSKEELAVGKAFSDGYGAFLWSIGQKVGLVQADCLITHTSRCAPMGAKGKLSVGQITACQSQLASVLHSSLARVVICLGVEAFEAVTGLVTWERAEQKELSKKIKRQGGHYKAKPIGIEQWALYLVKSGDCPVVTRIETQEVPDYTRLYKTTKKGKYKVGDPRMKKIKVEIETPRVLPRNTEWIMGAYHPSYVMKMGKKPLPGFVNALGRAVRALKGDLEIVDVQYETVVP